MPRLPGYGDVALPTLSYKISVPNHLRREGSHAAYPGNYVPLQAWGGQDAAMQKTKGWPSPSSSHHMWTPWASTSLDSTLLSPLGRDDLVGHLPEIRANDVRARGRREERLPGTVHEGGGAAGPESPRDVPAVGRD